MSALSHHLGLTLANKGVDDKTNEITQVETVLHQLVLQGGAMGGAPLLTQRRVARVTSGKGGSYVAVVREGGRSSAPISSWSCCAPPAERL